MTKRIITAVVGIPLLTFLLYKGDLYIFLGNLTITIIAILEYTFAMNKILKPKINVPLMVILTILLVYTMGYNYTNSLPALIIALVILFCYEVLNGKADVQRGISSFFGLMYVPIMLSFMLLFQYLPHGMVYLAMVFIVAFVTDTFALVIGLMFGKKTLAPKISPKKTIAGAIGGIIFAIISVIIYGLILKFYFKIDFPIWLCIVIGAVCSVAGQCGDLTASLIKRYTGIKDFGKCLPGHGGILDRFDSIIFILPVMYTFLIYTNNWI